MEGWEYPKLANQLPWVRSLRDAGFRYFSISVCDGVISSGVFCLGSSSAGADVLGTVTALLLGYVYYH